MSFSNDSAQVNSVHSSFIFQFSTHGLWFMGHGLWIMVRGSFMKINENFEVVCTGMFSLQAFHFFLKK